ncbi:hypothetical protein [Roseisalinus antarcticus]|uniref:Uncharacterized protein n=1 Tax=Roseisalinus antarcticus TaxID=254357 RepID=A0A1Y5RBS9_9RHOB|nr:hypothetical protein [Roseisalinus antarcticus]SLN13808.1 hypothetical protein ROA7023_00086 [Roseisalinus antarcticus]
MERMIRMIVRMFMKQGMNHIARGGRGRGGGGGNRNRNGGGGGGGGQGQRQDQGQGEGDGRQAAKRARQAMRATRRIGKF